MIGLGDIAEKAYLPVLAAQPGIELRLCTRNAATLARLGERYRVAARSSSVAEVLAAGVDAAFVHAATGAHPEIVAALLSGGAHVYVDKPVAYTLAESAALVRLARTAGRSLLVGFNRRYAPGYVGLAGRPRDLVVMQKNRAAQADSARRVLFDDFIHVVDTLRFLAPGPIKSRNFRTRVVDGLLESVVLELAGAGFTAIGSMHRLSGASEESCEVMGGGGKSRVVNLGEVIEYTPEGETLTRRPDWTSVARQRGIEQIVLAFLAAVGAGRVLDAGDALVTHEICEEIAAAAESAAA